MCISGGRFFRSAKRANAEQQITNTWVAIRSLGWTKPESCTDVVVKKVILRMEQHSTLSVIRIGLNTIKRGGTSTRAGSIQESSIHISCHALVASISCL